MSGPVEFFTVGYAWERGALHVEPLESLRAKRVLALFRGDEKPKTPLRLRVQSGKQRVDWVGTTFPPLCVASQALVDALSEINAGGWETFPVDIVDRHGEAIDDYHGFSVTGRSGPIDDNLSHWSIQPPISAKGKPYRMRKGLFFDESTWDGSPIFSPPGTGYVMVSEQAKSALEKARLTNLKFTPLTEAENPP